MLTKQQTIKEAFIAFKLTNPKTRIRDAAKELGTTEAELVATSCKESVVRLDVDIKDFFSKEISKLGKVKAITRNDDVVHERVGEYLNPKFNPKSPMGLFVGEDIDLRLFLKNWEKVFAVTEHANGKARNSIQFFNKFGNAIHKIYIVTDEGDVKFNKILETYASNNQSQEESVEPFTPEDDILNDNPNTVKFQSDWKALKDTHDFFILLKKHKLTRVQALELAPENFTFKIDNSNIRTLLQKASETQTPIMVFVANKDMIQIHTGPVKKVMEYGEWYNVMDPDFNLHLRESAVSQCWVVRKPTDDGIVTSVEVYDKNGTQICTFFGKRKPGIPEDSNWTEIANSLLKQ